MSACSLRDFLLLESDVLDKDDVCDLLLCELSLLWRDWPSVPFLLDDLLLLLFQSCIAGDNEGGSSRTFVRGEKDESVTECCDGELVTGEVTVVVVVVVMVVPRLFSDGWNRGLP